MTPKTLWLLLAFVAALPGGGAQAFPDRPIKLVVPTPAGGPPDVAARLLSDKMAAELGQPVVVENKAGGAAGMVGVKSVLTAEPDGYTLLVGSTSTLLIAPLVYKNAGYHAGSLAPVARVTDSAEMLCVHSSVPVQTVAELIALAKAKPGTLNFSTFGVGTLPHLEAELLKARAQIVINHIPYRGGGPALTALLAGEVQLLFANLTQTLPHVREGRLRGLAVTSAVRNKLAPDIPTMIESGFDQFVMTSVMIIAAPPGTPIEIRRRLNQAVNHALSSEEVVRALARTGGEARKASVEETGAFLAEQHLHLTRIVEATKLSVD